MIRFGLKTKEARDNEFAQVLDWQPQWDTGAPLPQVFSNGHKVYLSYLINVPDPDWDGSHTTMVSNRSDQRQPIALVEFFGRTFRFGMANDEVFHGLPLWGKGLQHYSAHIIENSSWMKEIDTIHKVHPQYISNRRNKATYNHYLFLFHDDLFEVIASGYNVETFNTTFKELAIEVAKRMNS